MPVARRKIAGILWVFQDFSTRPAAILAVKLGAEAIGTASKKAMKAGDMMSEEEILKLQQNTQDSNMEGVARPSKRWLRSKRRQHKK